MINKIFLWERTKILMECAYICGCTIGYIKGALGWDVDKSDYAEVEKQHEILDKMLDNILDYIDKEKLTEENK